MAVFRIISKDGNKTRAKGCPTYNGTYLAPSYLEFREIYSPSVIDWEVGDYVDYLSDSRCVRPNLRYKLYDIPSPTRRTDGFVYSNVQFFSAPKMLEICPFCDIVPDDNGIHFSTQQSVATFEDINGIIGRIQANVDKYYNGWEIRLYSGLQTANPDLYEIVTTPAEFTVSGGSCMDALTQCHEVFGGIGWVHFIEDGKDIIELGRPNVQDADNSTSIMKCGRGVKLISQSQSNRDTFGTRLYVYGSDRNINFQYYKGRGDILNAESLDIRNLMLPISQWGTTGGKYDAHKCYLEAPQSILDKYGVRPRFHYFDGSEDDEIFPTIGGATIKKVRDGLDEMGVTQYRPSTAVYSDSERVDEIKSADAIADDGIIHNGADFVAGETFTESTDTRIARVIADFDADKAFKVYEFTSPVTGRVRIEYAFGIFSDLTQGAVGKVTVAVNGVERWTQTEEYAIFDFDPNFSPMGEGEVPCSAGDAVALYVWLKGTPSSTNRMLSSIFNNTSDHITPHYRGKYADTFKIRLRQIGFDIASRQALAETGIATIAITKGVARTDGSVDCAGRSFAVKSCKYIAGNYKYAVSPALCQDCGRCVGECPESAISSVGGVAVIDQSLCVSCNECYAVCPFAAVTRGNSSVDEWEVECIRAYDESTGMAYPNNKYTIAGGDNFVLLDIAMPELYVKMAEAELLARGQELLSEISAVEPSYAPELDAEQMAHNPQAVREGMYFGMNDAHLTGGLDKYVLIDSITISEGESNIPTYRIALREKKSRKFASSRGYSSSSTPLTNVSIDANDKTIVHSQNVSKVVYVTSYPAILESGTLYFLVNSAGVVVETKIAI